VDRHLRDVTLALVPLHPKQQAYQAGKLVEMALHQLVVQVEKALDQQETALGVFLDIEGAFIIPGMMPCVTCLSSMVVNTPLCSGLAPPWRAAWLL
jgi:hypothetical protein